MLSIADLPHGPSATTPALGYSSVDFRLAARAGNPIPTIRCGTFLVAGPRLTRCRFMHRLHENGPDHTVRVGLGLFKLECDTSDPAYGFTFGGLLTVDWCPDCTLCHLESEAPILGVAADPAATSAFLYAEFVALLARERAAWGTNDAGFEHALLALTPSQLFVASVATLADHLGRLPNTVEMPEYAAGKKALARAIHILQRNQRWPEHPATFGDLLR